MKDAIIQAIKDVFNLDPDQDINTLMSHEEAKKIVGFNKLIQSLEEENLPPKLISEAWENVVLEIRMKDAFSDFEKALLEKDEVIIDSLSEWLC